VRKVARLLAQALIQERLLLFLVRLKALSNVVEATNDPCPDERLYLRPVVIRWYEDLVRRLENEGIVAHEQPVAGQGEDAAIRLL
jgi:hypothetical protein